jgi:cation:H+ antiporter
MSYLGLVAGLVLIAVSANLLVRGAAAIARQLDVPPLAIGVFVVGFGTSVPELVTSLTAALSDAPAISIGNVVGANIAVILLVLGAAGAVRAFPVDEVVLSRTGIVLALATGLLVLAAQLGEVSRLTGGLWLALFVLFAWQSYRAERRRRQRRADVAAIAASAVSISGRPPAGPILLAGLGVAGLVLGAHLTVGGAVEIAAALGIPQGIIAVTIVAIGTTLPEFLTSVVAASRGEPDLAIGNVIGSSIFNILAILGLTALVQPLPVAPEVAAFDVWVLAGAVAALLIFGLSGRRLGRLEGIGFLLAYFAFLAVQSIQAFFGGSTPL